MQLIIENVVNSLLEAPERRFVYVEMGYFTRYFREQSEARQEQIKGLVASGQLTFANGGWCMADEATTTLSDQLDMTARGHAFLMETFGYAPRLGWQIDPFGHSMEQAGAFGVGFGFEGVVLGRAHYKDLAQRVSSRTLEFRWGENKGSGTSFLGLLYGTGNYGPDGRNQKWDWNTDQSSPPIVDDPLLDGYNVDTIAASFADISLAWSAQFEGATPGAGGDIYFLMGSDFHHMSNSWFYNLDKLIREVNKQGRVNAFYSSPDAYLDAKLSSGFGAGASKDPTSSLTRKTDDFFPYADGEHAYWSGFFTSRPALKRLTRIASGYYASARQLALLAGSPAAPAVQLDVLDDGLATVQHHDGVSGTSKQHVAYDYAKRLWRGVMAAAPGVASATAKLSGLALGPAGVLDCPLLNCSICGATEALVKDGDSTEVSLWNPLGFASALNAVRVPVLRPDVAVVGPDGAPVAAQTMPLSPASRRLRKLHGASTDGVYELVFAPTLPALGHATFRLVAGGAGAAAASTVTPVGSGDAPFSFTSAAAGVSAAFNSNGELVSLSADGVDGAAASLSIVLYTELPGGGSEQAGGVYIMRPAPAHESEPLHCTQLVSGPVLTEAYCSAFGGATADEEWVQVTLRLAEVAHSALEAEWTVGPVDVGDGVGRSVAIRLSYDAQTAGQYWTDANARGLQQRNRNAWPADDDLEPVAANLFPVNSVLAISSRDRAAALLPDRACAGGSMADGQLELVLHRRLLHDDGRGMGEALNETEQFGSDARVPLTLRGTTRVLIRPSAQAAAAIRPVADATERPPLLQFAPKPPGASGAPYPPRAASFLATPLPPQLQLLTLAPLPATHKLGAGVLLRLAHGFQADRGSPGWDATLSAPASVDLASLLQGVRPSAVTELRLSAAAERKPDSYPPPGSQCGGSAPPASGCIGAALPPGGAVATLGPNEVRAFHLRL